MTAGIFFMRQLDRVTPEGQVYESLVDANTWSPTEYP